MQAKMKVNMYVLFIEKHADCKSLVLQRLLFLSNIETDRGCLGKEGACNNL